MSLTPEIDGREILELSNDYICSFTYDGYTWNSVQQFYQAYKFQNEAYRKRINEEPDIIKIYKLGQSQWHSYVPNFNEKKVDIMFWGNFYKITQNEEIAAILKQTSGPIIFRQGSPFWKQHNSRILEVIRGRLKAGLI